MTTVSLAQRPTENATDYHIITQRQGYAGHTAQPRCGQDSWGKSGHDIDTQEVDIDQFRRLVRKGRVCERCLEYADISLSNGTQQ